MRREDGGLSAAPQPTDLSSGALGLGEIQHGNIRQLTFPGTAPGPRASLSGYELVNLAELAAVNTKQTAGATASEPVLDKRWATGRRAMLDRMSAQAGNLRLLGLAVRIPRVGEGFQLITRNFTSRMHSQASHHGSNYSPRTQEEEGHVTRLHWRKGTCWHLLASAGCGALDK